MTHSARAFNSVASRLPLGSMLLAICLILPQLTTAKDAATLPVRPGPAHTSISATSTLITPDREAAAKRIIEKTKAFRGWFLTHDQHRLELQVPAHQAEALLDFAQTQGHQVDRSFSTLDNSQQWLQAKSSLEAKEGLLEDYMAILSKAETESIFAVERAINELRAEIEAAKGRLRKVEHDIAYARINVYFRFPDRPEPARDAASSFDWVNRLNLADLLEDFRHVKD